MIVEGGPGMLILWNIGLISCGGCGCILGPTLYCRWHLIHVVDGSGQL
jgi:hypothetical protein